MNQAKPAPLSIDPASAVVLNVDDQEHARYTKSRLLRKAGYKVIEATSGQEALDVAASRLPDAIMLDVNLPDIVGFDVCRRLKSDPATRSIPVVQVSASFTSTTDQAEGLEGGADAYLTAPTDPRVLLGTMRAMIRIRFAEKQLERLLVSEREARKEAERAGRMKDEFLATLSHELRTPLNAVIGWAQILARSTNNPEEVAKGVAVIQRNARAQATLISELLDMNRILAGKTKLERSRQSLCDLVRNATETARPQAEAKGLRLELKLPDGEGCMANIDAARVQQIMANLIGNAIKFTPAGGRITIEVANDNAKGEHTITVSDTGPGIKPDFLPFVFDRFRQEDSSTTRSHGGLGLGLAIVRHLVTLHGGRVSVASEGLGKGASFYTVFPHGAGEGGEGREGGEEGPHAEPAQPSKTAADAAQFDAAALNGVRVLVVDDEVDAREMVARVLKQFGCETVLAASAAEAIATQLSRPCDVIISDIGMPGADGYTLLEQLRAAGDSAPAIALTAFARDEDGHRAATVGYDSHIAKPFESGQLVAAIQRLAKR